MNKKLLSVTPKSQFFPIPMIMDCESVSVAMLLQYSHHNIKAAGIMKYWPTHPNNPYKGYVGHHLLVRFGHHQTIFPSAYVPYLQTFDSRVIDGTGTNLEELETAIDQGQPVLMCHTSLGQKPSRRTFKFDNHTRQLVSNIHVILLTGYDGTHYCYIDPLWSHFLRKVIVPTLVPNRFQIIKIKKESTEHSFNAPDEKCTYVKP